MFEVPSPSVRYPEAKLNPPALNKLIASEGDNQTNFDMSINFN